MPGFRYRIAALRAPRGRTHAAGDATPAAPRKAEVIGYEEEVFESLCRLGQLAQTIGRSEIEARHFFHEAHTLLPDRAEPLYHLGRLNFQVHQFRQAATILHEALIKG